MTNINMIGENLKISFINGFKNQINLSNWSSRLVTYIQNIPNFMKNNQAFAISFIAVANIVSFFAVNAIVSQLEERTQRHLPPMSNDSLIFKKILLNFVAIAGSVVAFNSYLSKSTDYPIRKEIVGIIAVISVIARILLYNRNEKARIEDLKAKSLKLSDPHLKTLNVADFNKIMDEHAKAVGMSGASSSSTGSISSGSTTSASSSSKASDSSSSTTSGSSSTTNSASSSSTTSGSSSSTTLDSSASTASTTSGSMTSDSSASATSTSSGSTTSTSAGATTSDSAGSTASDSSASQTSTSSGSTTSTSSSSL